LAAIALSVASTASADTKDLVVDLKPVFQSASISAGPTPVAVDIENKGPDAKGQIVVSNGYTFTRYPVDLPRGAKKRVLTYPGVNNYYGGQLEFTLDTDQGTMKLPYSGGTGSAYGSYSVALIGDTPGELAFMRQQDKVDRKNPNSYQEQRGYIDCYCKPEEAPDRPIGYRDLSAVILGSGSERLSDDSIRALQTYALTGGTVVIVGGASAPVLTDRRWAAFLPATSFSTKTIRDTGILNQIGGAPVSETFTIASGKPLATAKAWREGEDLIAASRALGLGKVVLLAFNPFEDPFIRWSGRKKLFVSMARFGDSERMTMFLNQFQATNNQEDMYGGGTAGYPAPTTYSPYYNQTQADPFDVELPKPNKVFWILVGYFVAVVPLNFLILRKLKRGELAWITAPVLSLIFAGVFLNEASDLYAASLSTASNGLIVAQDGLPNSVFIGNTQMFFPQGGVYDLKLKNVDELGTDSGGARLGEGESRTDLNPVDVGSVLVPEMRAANLAFEQISYRQVVDRQTYVSGQVVSKNANFATVRLFNRSGQSLGNVSLAAMGRRIDVGQMDAGATKDVRVPTTMTDDQNGDDLAAVTRRFPVMIAIATMGENFRPGPQIGVQVASKTSVRLACVMDLPMGENR